MPLGIIRPDSGDVRVVARTLITGEGVRTTKGGKLPDIGRITEVVRPGDLDEALRDEWFPPRTPPKWAHNALLRVQWFVCVGGGRGHPPSPINIGAYERMKDIPELDLTTQISLVSDQFAEGLVMVVHVPDMQNERFGVRSMADVYVIMREEAVENGLRRKKGGRRELEEW
jgi:hypothetical protein